MILLAELQINQSNVQPDLETACTNSRLDSQNGRSWLKTVSMGYQKPESEKIDKGYLSLDWLTLIAQFENYEEFKEKTQFFFDYLDDDLAWHENHAGKIGRCFSTIWRTIRGGQVGINILPEGRIDCAFKLTGSVLGGASPDKLKRALLHLYPWFVSCTRLDVAYDNKSGILAEIRPKAFDCWKAGLISGFKAHPRHYGGQNPENDLITHQFGTRNSGRLCRNYDKPEVQGQRFEVQVMRSRSKAIFKELISYLEQDIDYLEALTNVFSLAIEGIEFYEENKDVNLKRNVICDWWLEFKELVQYKNLELPKVQLVKSLEKSIAWIRKQVAPTIAAINQFYGVHFPDLIADIISKGKDRISAVHKAEIERAKQQGKDFINEWYESQGDVMVSYC